MEQQKKRMMQHIEMRYGDEPEYLWAKYPDYAVFRHSGSKNDMQPFWWCPETNWDWTGQILCLSWILNAAL